MGKIANENRVYVAIIEDKRTDTDCEVFTNRVDAIKYAKEEAMKGCRHREDYHEEDVEGWEFHATYSCEGDNVRVLEKILR